MKKLVLMCVLSLFAFANITVSAPVVDGVAEYSAVMPAAVEVAAVTVPARHFTVTGEATRAEIKYTPAVEYANSLGAARFGGTYEVGWRGDC